jgi:hypothetical protein
MYIKFDKKHTFFIKKKFIIKHLLLTKELIESSIYYRYHSISHCSLNNN